MDKQPKNLIDLLERSCLKFPDNPYVWEKRQGKYTAVTYLQTREQVRLVAAGLLAMGLKKGERVALWSEGCCEWIYAELGILYAGGINVPLSIKLTEQELIFRIMHSGARFMVVSVHYLEVMKRIREQLPLLEEVFVIGAFSSTPEGYTSFSVLKERGEKWQQQHNELLDACRRAIRPEDVANISYTSGTTAEPKGIMLTHANYVFNVLQADSLIQIPTCYRVLLFLPWDHSFAHTVGLYSFMYNGASLACVDFGRSSFEYLRNIPVNLKEIRPHVLLSVPSIAGNFRKNIEAGIRKKGKWMEYLYRKCLQLAYCYYGESGQGPQGWKCLLYPGVKIADSLFFARLRKVFGGELKFFVGGGALLDVELQRYYKALGVPMYQGYGLSEASPVISSNTPRKYKFGSSGLPADFMELKICDEEGRELPRGEAGEIVIKGGNVMKGYWQNEQATRETIVEGWLHTGDLGYVDEQGFLYVQGRFKSLLIANDGEKYSPEGIEEAIVEKSDYIDACILYNNQSPYTAALIVPNKMALREYLNRKKIEMGTVEGYKLMLNKIHKELMAFRYGGKYAGIFPERWLPAVVAILPEPLSERNGTVNSTAKVVRRRVIELYRDELEFVYTSEGKNILNVRNTLNIKKLFTD